MNKQAILEAVKEVARIALFAAITAVVGWLSEKVAGLDPSSVYYVVGTLFLRAVDKYIHKSPSENQGLAPF